MPRAVLRRRPRAEAEADSGELRARGSSAAGEARGWGRDSGGAVGMAPLALGTDLAGSLRVPAAFCGVAALRPTERR